MELSPKQPACSGTHETRLLFVFRREGICVDRSAINLDTSTGSRSPVKNFGRFSFRGPCRLARKMAVREKRLTRTPTRVKPYPKASGHFSPTTRALPATDASRNKVSASHGHVGAQPAAPHVRTITAPLPLASCHNARKPGSPMLHRLTHPQATVMYGRSTAAPHVRAITAAPSLASCHPPSKQQPRKFPPSHIETTPHLPYYSPHRRCPSKLHFATCTISTIDSTRTRSHRFLFRQNRPSLDVLRGHS